MKLDALIMEYPKDADRRGLVFLYLRKIGLDGGPGSGNFGHKGRPGKVGGSGKGEGSSSSGEGGRVFYAKALNPFFRKATSSSGFHRLLKGLSGISGAQNNPTTLARLEKLAMSKIKNYQDDVTEADFKAYAIYLEWKAEVIAEDGEDEESWGSALWDAYDNGGELMNLSKKETKEFLKLVMNPDDPYFEQDPEKGFINNASRDQLARYILLKNKALGGEEPCENREKTISLMKKLMDEGEAAERTERKKYNKKWLEAKNTYIGKSAEIKKAFDSCKNAADVEKVFNKYGMFTTEAHLGPIDDKKSVEVGKAFNNVFNEFPFMVGRTFPVRVDDISDKNVMGLCVFGTGEITLDADYFGNEQTGTIDVEPTYRHGVEIGFHPVGTEDDAVKAVVTHELGHALENVLHNTIGGGRESISWELRDRVCKSLGVDWLDARAVKGELSQYATDCSEEWFAEAFCEAMCSKTPRRMARQFMLELKKMIREEEEDNYI